MQSCKIILTGIYDDWNQGIGTMFCRVSGAKIYLDGFAKCFGIIFKTAKFTITGYIKYICFIFYTLEALAPGGSLAEKTLPLPGPPILRNSKWLSYTGSPIQCPYSEPPPLPCSCTLGGNTSLRNHPRTRIRQRGTARAHWNYSTSQS